MDKNSGDNPTLVGGKVVSTLDSGTRGIGDGTVDGLSTAVVSKGRLPYLVVVIPTIPRPGGVDYLSSTVWEWLRQAPDSSEDILFREVLLVVVNLRPGEHAVFDRLKKEVSRSSRQWAVEFQELSVPLDGLGDSADIGE